MDGHEIDKGENPMDEKKPTVDELLKKLKLGWECSRFTC
jgi:hypothetical protein